MASHVDIARLEWGSARIAHCRFPAWEVGEHESVSAPSSVGFSFTTQRRATVAADGRARERDVLAGHVGLIGETPVSWLRVHEPSEVIEITGSPGLRRAVADELGSAQWAELAERDAPADPAAWAIAARFRSAIRGGVPLNGTERDTLVRLLYANMFRSLFGGTLRIRGDGALDKARLARVIDYVEAHLGLDLSLDRLADVAALSPFHFLRSFRAATGIAPHQYVTMRRMERALEMLIAGEAPARVAALSGYSSRSWFGAAFRRHFGFRITDIPVRGVRRWL